jgi:NADP-reducing hydrogenase subunit HndC
LIFKDRVLIDTNPHQILEGIAIAGYACGAQEAFIYIRGEYEMQAQRLERAIAQAAEHGWLGDHIQGSEFSFHIHVHRGAGAYICGEETALLDSLEGQRGEPRVRPPYPPTSGYRSLPTLVNNVETYAATPSIIVNGAQWFRSLSTASTPGTKMYMLLGHVQQPGLFEAPFGLTLRQIIDDFGGGMRDGATFHFALTGGAAGTIVPPSLLDIPSITLLRPRRVTRRRRVLDLRSNRVAGGHAARSAALFRGGIVRQMHAVSRGNLSRAGNSHADGRGSSAADRCG